MFDSVKNPFEKPANQTQDVKESVMKALLKGKGTVITTTDNSPIVSTEETFVSMVESGELKVVFTKDDDGVLLTKQHVCLLNTFEDAYFQELVMNRTARLRSYYRSCLHLIETELKRECTTISDQQEYGIAVRIDGTEESVPLPRETFDKEKYARRLAFKTGQLQDKCRDMRLEFAKEIAYALFPRLQKEQAFISAIETYKEKQAI